MTILTDGNGNTRLNQENKLSIHCDYLRLHRDSMSQADFEQLLNFINPNHVVEMEKPWSPGGGSVYFSNKVIGTRGFVGGFDVNEDESIHCMVDIPGEYWDQENVVDTWRLFQGIKHCYQMKCSRVDYSIDDSTYWIIPVVEMEQAWRDKLNFSFRNFKYIESGDNPDDMCVTRYFGSRNSGRFTRIYDHDGECLRHETEFKRQYAQPSFDCIADLKREDFENTARERGSQESIGKDELSDFGVAIQRAMGSLVVGAIDFRDRSAYKDSSRVGHRDSQRLGFYQQYIDYIGGNHFRLRVSSPVKSVRKTWEWIKRSCAPTLGAIATGLGTHQYNLMMQELVEMGKQRMDNSKELLAKEIRQSPRMFQIA